MFNDFGNFLEKILWEDGVFQANKKLIILKK
jgi:hypothetical protein